VAGALAGNQGRLVTRRKLVATVPVKLADLVLIIDALNMLEDESEGTYVAEQARALVERIEPAAEAARQFWAEQQRRRAARAAEAASG
jgi:hypothetical protein